MINIIPRLNAVFVRSPYNYVRCDASEESSLKCPPGEDRAQQQFKDECDINTIVARFGLTGRMPEGIPGSYGDFTEVVDFQTAMLAVREADEAFMSLPSDVRKRFHNNPQEMFVFLGKDENRAEAERMGLVAVPQPVVKAPPMEVVVVPVEGAAPPSGGA